MQKSFLASRTFWLNAVTTLIAVVTVISGSEWVKDYPGTATGLLFAVAVLNVILRFLTDTPISVKVVILASLVTLSAGPVSAQLMPADREARIRQVMPDFASEEFNSVAHDESLLLYTEAEMPKAYQLTLHPEFGAPYTRLHSPYQNIAANPDPTSNANHELPWNEAAGTDRVENLEAVRFLWLPIREDGKRWPVAVARQTIGNDPGTTTWTFPRGSVVGEMFTLRSPSGRDYPFEVRTRTKFEDGWRMEVYRPYPTNYSLARRLRELGEQELAAKVAKPLAGVPIALRNPHPKRVIDEHAHWQALPKMPVELVEKLLKDATFHECSHTAWNYSNGQEQHAPAVAADDKFNIVPARYEGAVIPVSDASCVRCHQTTLHPAEEFAPNRSIPAYSLDSPYREWYGRVRGSDHVFSFHPFEPNGIGNGSVRYRQSLLTAGIIAPYDAKKHPAERYRRGT